MGKCKCDCEMRLYTQNIRHANEMQRVLDAFNKLRRDMAWLEYELTGNRKALDKFEYYLKNGAF
jgi:hypothetical protein